MDGHSLQIKFSHRKSNTNEAGKPGSGKSVTQGTKLIVRNVPFEATKKDLRELFGYVFVYFDITFGIFFSNGNFSDHLVNSSPCVYRRSSMADIVVLPFWN